MNEFFSRIYDVDYRAVNKNLSLTLPCLMEYFQETSIKHSDSVGYPIEWFKENMEAFVLTNWHVKIFNYPKFRDKMKIMTFPIMFKGFIAERNFQAFDLDENLIAVANSKWIYLDLNNFLPKKIDKTMFESFAPFEASPLPKAYIFKLNEAYKLINKTSFTTKKSDIDSNMHINNTKYIFWALDMFGDEIYYSDKICELKAEYKKQCTENMTLTAELYKNNDEYIVCIKDDEQIFSNVYIKMSSAQ